MCMLSSVSDVRQVIREDDVPFFTDAQIEFYVRLYGSYDLAAYNCLIIKSQNSQLQIAGMTTQDTSDYFKRLARQFRPVNSGTLKV